MNKFNKKGHRHGIYLHYEWNPFGKLRCKCTVNNGMLIGYGEWYHEKGEMYIKQINI